MEFLDPKPPPRLAGRYDRGYLPHLRAQGRSYFVTFRLHGTLPQEVLRQYQAEREALLAKARAAGAISRMGVFRAEGAPVRKPALPPAGKPAIRSSDIPLGEELSAEERRRLFELYSEKIEAYLDAGRGECWLQEPRIGELVAGALRFFHGQRYDLGPWVVMPNYVRVIIRPLRTHLLDEIVKSWKGFTAREANKLLKKTGDSFWAREYYDHLVRDDQERARLTDYVHDNPRKARLCAGWEDWPLSSAHPRWR